MTQVHYKSKETKINVLFDVSEQISQEIFICLFNLFKFLQRELFLI